MAHFKSFLLYEDGGSITTQHDLTYSFANSNRLVYSSSLLSVRISGRKVLPIGNVVGRSSDQKPPGPIFVVSELDFETNSARQNASQKIDQPFFPYSLEYLFK